MKPIVISGNGPSLANIDYRRLPTDFDVYRVNNFYFEDHYWLTKKVAGYFVPHLEQLALQFFNMFELKKRNEYNIEQIYTPLCGQSPDLVNFPSVKFIDFLKSGILKIDECMAFYNFYQKKIPTTGVRMILEAIVQGYTEIYLCGFDLYNSKIHYPFEISKTLFELHPDKELFKKSFEQGREVVELHHSSEYDALLIKLASKVENVTMYSISENSPINRFIPLAPIVNVNPYIPTKKPENYLNEWIKNPRVIRIEQERLEQERLEQERNTKKDFIQKIKQLFINKNMEAEWDYLLQNIYLRLIYHAIKPILVIIKFTLKPDQKEL